MYGKKIKRLNLIEFIILLTCAMHIHADEYYNYMQMKCDPSTKSVSFKNVNQWNDRPSKDDYTLKQKIFSKDDLQAVSLSVYKDGECSFINGNKIKITLGSDIASTHGACGGSPALWFDLWVNDKKFLSKSVYIPKCHPGSLIKELSINDKNITFTKYQLPNFLDDINKSIVQTKIITLHYALKQGKYSWFKGGAQAYLTITKLKSPYYAITGDCYYGIGRKYGPNMGDLDFTAPLVNGKIVYKKSGYTFVLTTNADGSFDVYEEGLSPFGHNASFYGHYTSDATPSFSCEKASTFIEKAICNDVKIAQLDKEMARLYSVYKSAFFFEKEKVSLEKKLHKEQKEWLKKRNACVYKKSYALCLKERYIGRIKVLEERLHSYWKYDD